MRSKRSGKCLLRIISMHWKTWIAEEEENTLCLQDFRQRPLSLRWSARSRVCFCCFWCSASVRWFIHGIPKGLNRIWTALSVSFVFCGQRISLKNWTIRWFRPILTGSEQAERKWKVSAGVLFWWLRRILYRTVWKQSLSPIFALSFRWILSSFIRCWNM